MKWAGERSEDGADVRLGHTLVAGPVESGRESPQRKAPEPEPPAKTKVRELDLGCKDARREARSRSLGSFGEPVPTSGTRTTDWWIATGRDA